MLKLLEEARLRAFWRPEDGTDAAPTAVFDMSVLEGGGTRATLDRAAGDRVPAPGARTGSGRSTCSCGSAASAARASRSATRCSAPRASEPQVLYARATAVVVLVDTASGRPTRWGAAERDAWAPFVGEPIVYAKRR